MIAEAADAEADQYLLTYIITAVATTTAIRTTP